MLRFKIIPLLFLLWIPWQFLHCQEVGFRIANASGGMVAVDGVFSINDIHRIHGDLSIGKSGVGLSALWNFIYKPLSGEAFHWYSGVGPYLVLRNDFALGASFEVGLEYRFKDVPLVAAIDYRPQLEVIDYPHFIFYGFGLNLRWAF